MTTPQVEKARAKADSLRSTWAYRVALGLTAAWIAGWAGIAVWSGDDRNEWGDFVAGGAGVATVIWLVATAFLQRIDLKQARDERRDTLKEQRETTKQITAQAEALAKQTTATARLVNALQDVADQVAESRRVEAASFASLFDHQNLVSRVGNFRKEYSFVMCPTSDVRELRIAIDRSAPGLHLENPIVGRLLGRKGETSRIRFTVPAGQDLPHRMVLIYFYVDTRSQPRVTWYSIVVYRDGQHVRLHHEFLSHDSPPMPDALDAALRVEA